jgi:hypothetical protein
VEGDYDYYHYMQDNFDDSVRPVFAISLQLTFHSYSSLSPPSSLADCPIGLGLCIPLHANSICNPFVSVF